MNTRRAGLAWAFLAVLLWSLSIPLTKAALGGFDVFVVAMGREVIAGLIASIILLIRRPKFPDRSLWKPLAWTALGAVFGWPLLLALGLQYSSSAHAAVITSVMPLVTAALAVLVGGEKVRRVFWLAAAVGTATLVIYVSSRGGLEGGSLLGDLLLIGAVLTSSWGYVFGASAARQMPGWQVISWIVALTLPITLPFTVIMWLGSRTNFSPDGGQWSALVILGVFSAYLGFFAWYRGLAMAGTAMGSQVQQLQALLAIGWSAVLLGEQITLGTVLAACVVIVAVAWAQRARISSGALSAPLD